MQFLGWKRKFPDFKRMDEELLGAKIRHYAHMLDKTVKMEWKESRGVRHKENLVEALKVWRERQFDASDDILWAETILDNFDVWNKQKKPVFRKYGERKPANIEDVLRQRRSIRCFEARDVEKEKIIKVLEAGTWAPSSGNRQALKFIVKKRVAGEVLIKKELAFETAPWIKGSHFIYVAVDTRPYGKQEKFAGAMDAAAAIQNMLLMAEYLGLGAGWLYMADLIEQKQLRNILKLQGHHYVYSAILVGYPLESPRMPGRKPFEKTVNFL